MIQVFVSAGQRPFVLILDTDRHARVLEPLARRVAGDRCEIKVVACPELKGPLVFDLTCMATQLTEINRSLSLNRPGVLLNAWSVKKGAWPEAEKKYQAELKKFLRPAGRHWVTAFNPVALGRGDPSGVRVGEWFPQSLSLKQTRVESRPDGVTQGRTPSEWSAQVAAILVCGSK